MVIVDTSVWVEAMRVPDDRLSGWITADEIVQHPFVTAEIGMGSFRSADDRFRTIDLLDSFAQIEVANAQAFHAFVADNALFGTGIGFADAHLLHSCHVRPAAQLATNDKRLSAQAGRLGIEVV
jgi:predicted nucleic acid-binding protein